MEGKVVEANTLQEVNDVKFLTQTLSGSLKQFVFSLLSEAERVTARWKQLLQVLFQSKLLAFVKFYAF